MSIVFQESVMDVLKFQGGFKDVLRKLGVFAKNVKDVSRKLHECFKEVSRVFQVRLKGISSSFKGISKKFKWCVREV